MESKESRMSFCAGTSGVALTSTAAEKRSDYRLTFALIGCCKRGTGTAENLMEADPQTHVSPPWTCTMRRSIVT